MADTNKEFYTEWTESYDSFDEMGLQENLLRGIFAYGESHGKPAWGIASASEQGPGDGGVPDAVVGGGGRHSEG